MSADGKQVGERQVKRAVLTDALLVVAATSLAYVSAYQYEKAYLSFFKLPEDLIVVTVERVIGAGVAIVAFLVSILVMFNIIVPFMHKEFDRKDDLRRRSVIVNLAFVALYAVLVKGFGFSWWGLGVLLAWLAIFNGLFLVLPAVGDYRRHPEKTPIFSRVERSFSESPIADDAQDRISRALGKELATLLFLVVPLTLLISWAAGHRAAKNQKMFTVSEDYNVVLIRQYGGTFILKEVDPCDRLFGEKFYITNADGVAAVTFRSMALADLQCEI